MSISNGKDHPNDHFLNNANREKVDESDDFLSEIDFGRIVKIFMNNIILLMFLFIGFIVVAYVYLRYTKPTYESNSSLRLSFKRDGAKILGLNGSMEDFSGNLSGEIELIKSELIYSQVIKEIDINVSYYVYGKIIDEERYKNSPFIVKYNIFQDSSYDIPYDIQFINNESFEISYTINNNRFNKICRFGESIKNEYFNFIINKTSFFVPELISNKFYFIINSYNTLNNYLATNLSVDILNANANIIGIYFKDNNAIKARDIVGKVDTVYLEATLSQKNKSNDQKILFLNKQLTRVEDSLDMYSFQIENFAIKEKSTDIEGDFGKSIDKLEELMEEKMILTPQLSQFQSLKDVVVKGSKINDFLPPLISSDPQINSWVNNLTRLQEERELLSGSVKSTTFALQSKDKEIMRAKSNLLLLINQSSSLLINKINRLDGKISQIENGFNNLPAKSSQYSKLKLFKDLYQKFYLQMMERQAEIGIANAGTTPDFVILSPANLSSTSIAPVKMMVYLIGGAAGLIVCLLFIIIKYLIHNTITSQRELERVTNVPILGIIPVYTKDKMSTSRLIIDKHPKALISEALRSIRTNMEFMLNNKKKKKIMSVTSTVGGEGKTFVSMNLAGVIALSQTKVVLLDLDMRKPKLHIAFETENEKGISTILIGKHIWEDCVQKTPIPNLDFITAGPIPPNPSEIILRPEFDELLEQLHQKYDIIVIDTPPAGLVTDGILVMRKADLLIYIVRADYSKRSFVKNINQLVDNQKFSNLSIILNSCSVGGGYGYNNTYNYGYYEEEDDKNSVIGKIIKKVNN